MNKQEILQKAQSIRTNAPDEMELQIMQKGNGMAMVFILLFCLIFMIMKMIAKQPWYDVYSIAFVGMGVQNIHKGIKLHRKYEISVGIAYSLLAVLIAAAYVYNILG